MSEDRDLSNLKSVEATLLIQAACKSFWIFFRDIFSISHLIVENKFFYGDFLEKRCNDIQNHRRRVEEAARKHIKSTLRHAKVMWYLFKLDKDDRFYRSGKYFSASKKMACEHIEKINIFISVNPFFSQFKKISDAKYIAEYTTPAGRRLKYEPEGITSFSRGGTYDDVICDDILRDDETEELIQTERVKRVFEEVIVSLVKIDGELDVVGTPQDEDDLLSDLMKNPSFHHSFYPIWRDELRTIPQWPENFTPDHINNFLMKTMRKNAFEQEYMCVPARSATSYFLREEITPLVNVDLKPYDHRLPITFNGVLKGGLDIGKKRHPSHLVVFEEINGKYKQRLSFFMDEWDYVRQIAFCKKLIADWGIKLIVYDNTRAEFEAVAEGGGLPREMTPMTFTSKTKSAMAMIFEEHVMRRDTELLNDPRSIKQILGVDNKKLESIETKDGHGEAFWSIAMALEAFDQNIILPLSAVFTNDHLAHQILKEPIRRGIIKRRLKDEEVKYEIIESDRPKLGIYENPKPDCEYRIGVFNSLEEGRTIAIVKETLLGTPAAVYYSTESADKVAFDLAILGGFYKDGLMAIANLGNGLSILNILEKELYYPNVYYDVYQHDRNDFETKRLGFTLDEKSKLLLINLQKEMLEEKKTFILNRIILNAHRMITISNTGEIKGINEDYVWADALASFLVHSVPVMRFNYDEYQYNTESANPIGGY